VEALYAWLVFAEINDRRERVHDAHQRTFRWIFEEDNDARLTDWSRNLLDQRQASLEYVYLDEVLRS
jgi:hypothetical protein